MGMFDWLKVEYDLGKFNFLKTESPPCGFQTKSLLNCMDTYILSADGRLLWSTENDMNYPGILSFHIPCEDKWYEFTAIFDSTGQMVELAVVISPCPFTVEVRQDIYKLL